MKIGGAPMWIKPNDPDTKELKGQFLCCFSSIVPPSNVPYPWANQKGPLSLEEVLSYPNNQVLIWFDGFICYFFLDENGKIDWDCQI
jgi:hypothetical protein